MKETRTLARVKTEKQRRRECAPRSGEGEGDGLGKLIAKKARA
jgi:hypothetical protein